MKILGRFFFIINKFINRCLSQYLTSLVNTENGIINAEVDLYHPENIFLGKNSYVNGGKLYAGNSSKIIIGNNCMISYGVHIRTTTHNYKDRNVPMNNQGGYEKDIIIVGLDMELKLCRELLFIMEA